MEHLDRPDEATWDERRLWFEGREAAAARARAGAPAPSEQACALMIDLQAVFCAGAWAAAVILAAAIIDCQARASGTRNGDTPKGVDGDTWRWLRTLRNRLVHEDRSDPALTIDDQWQRRAEWERHARRAVDAAFAALYPGSTQP